MAKLARIPLSPKAAEKRINEIAQNTDNVIITIHGNERIDSEAGRLGLGAQEIYEILREGMITEDPQYNPKTGDYKYKIIRRMDTLREAGCVTVIMNDAKLLVITAMWIVK